MKRITLTTNSSEEYELIDSGEEEKIERYGSVILVRPDPQALWEKHLPAKEWRGADASYARIKGQGSAIAGKQGEWRVRAGFPKEWPVTFGKLQFIIRATSFKHTGLFPEQLSNWEWIREVIEHSRQEKPRILNLFAYTGGATLAAARAGAAVTHVDASKTAVAWARENADASGLVSAPVRWIVEDALTFVKREIKRGSTYDAVIMDPPAFGHGPKDELWKIEEDLIKLFRLCEQLLSPEPLFVLVSGYAAGYSPLALAYNLERFEKKFGGTIEYGDLTIQERKTGKGSEPRLLPCGIFGRWSRA